MEVTLIPGVYRFVTCVRTKTGSVVGKTMMFKVEAGKTVAVEQAVKEIQQPGKRGYDVIHQIHWCASISLFTLVAGAADRAGPSFRGQGHKRWIFAGGRDDSAITCAQQASPP